MVAGRSHREPNSILVIVFLPLFPLFPALSAFAGLDYLLTWFVYITFARTGCSVCNHLTLPYAKYTFIQFFYAQCMRTTWQVDLVILHLCYTSLILLTVTGHRRLAHLTLSDMLGAACSCWPRISIQAHWKETDSYVHLETCPSG